MGVSVTTYSLVPFPFWEIDLKKLIFAHEIVYI